jgi:hypothetical protein
VMMQRALRDGGNTLPLGSQPGWMPHGEEALLRRLEP